MTQGFSPALWKGKWSCNSWRFTAKRLWGLWHVSADTACQTRLPQEIAPRLFSFPYSSVPSNFCYKTHLRLIIRLTSAIRRSKRNKSAFRRFVSWGSLAFSPFSTLYHKNGRKIPGTESKITGKLVGRTTKRWRFYWWRHLLKLNKFHIDGQRFLQTVFDWQLHCCDFLFGGVNKAIYCWT